MKNIAKALLEAQKLIKNAEKDGSNTFFKKDGKNSRYASLESVLHAVKEIANSVGIAIVQTCGKDAEGHFVGTRIIHESGEELESKVYLVIEPNKQNMQGLGSAITYGRRYSLAAMFAIGQDDDDGNASSAPEKQTQQQRPPATKDKPKPSGAPSPIKTTSPSTTDPSFHYDDRAPSRATTPPKTTVIDAREVLRGVISAQRKRLNWNGEKLSTFIQQNFAKTSVELSLDDMNILVKAMEKIEAPQINTGA